jgi:hypothetical protein
MVLEWLYLGNSIYETSYSAWNPRFLSDPDHCSCNVPPVPGVHVFCLPAHVTDYDARHRSIVLCSAYVHLYVHLCEFPVIHQHLSKQSHRFSPNANFIIWMWIGGPPSVHVNSLLPLQHSSLLVPRHHSSPASDAHCFVAIAVVLLPFPSMALLPSLDQISTGLLLQLLISTLTLPSCLHCLTNFSVNVSTDTRHSFFLFLFLRIGYESL